MSTQQHDTLPTRYVSGEEGELGGPDGDPFYRVRLSLNAAAELADLLEQAAAVEGRRWFHLTAKEGDASKLKFVDFGRTPQYELQAPPHYVRGQQFRVTGRDASCNIEFSKDGASRLAAELREASSEARAFVVMGVAKGSPRRDHMVSFRADTEPTAAGSAELVALGLAGAALAEQVWPEEDFSDWDV
jgi:hypothetical protein